VKPPPHLAGGPGPELLEFGLEVACHFVYPQIMSAQQKSSL
jgi:hypothetical protein